MKKLAKRELQLGCGAALAASGVPPILLAGGFLRCGEVGAGCGGARSRLLSSSGRESAHSFGRRIFKMERTHVRCYGGGAGADLLRFTSPAVFSTPSSKFSPLRFEAKPA